MICNTCDNNLATDPDSEESATMFADYVEVLLRCGQCGAEYIKYLRYEEFEICQSDIC